MNDLPLKNQIIEWLKPQPYWYQFAGNKLLEGAEINDLLIDTTLNFFKEDAALIQLVNERTPIAFDEIPIVAADSAISLNLNAIHSIENVNALVTGQEINIDKNLTAIYGNNGSGKSGYIRLLNNTFNSRGDKSLLGNVFSETPSGSPKCKFVFQSTGAPYEKEFPSDKGCLEFSMYSTFDIQSVKVHLDDDNQLNFTPSGFEFFEKVLQLFEALKAKLNNNIQASRPQNNFIIHFQNENVFKNHIAQLGANSNIEEITKLADYTEADAIQLEEIKAKIAALKALNVQVQIAGLEKILRDLLQVMQRQQLILDSLTKEKVEYCIGLIDAYQRLQALSQSEGIKSLENYNIDLISSPQWRDFIVAAKNYTTAIEQNREGNLLYPTDKDYCVFCLQPLTEKENVLINTYWQFLKSEAERELNRTLQKIKDVEKELKGLYPVKFDETLALYEYLNPIDPVLVVKWKALVSNTETTRQNLIQNLSNLNQELAVSSFIDHTSDFNILSLQIKQEIDALFAKKPDQEIESLTFKLLLLTDKSLLSKLLPDVVKFISAHLWANAAEHSLSAFRTNTLTTFQGALFAQHITDKYSTTFNEECKKLNAPSVVDISQQNSKAKSFRKLLVAKQTASQVLSEGEQRAISLADFLTEVQLNPNNRGVIFDDPVTSLDHERRAIIAKRLVELSETKQVIIFTHDISFFAKLTSFAETNAAITITKTSIRKFGNSIGLIKPEMPWIAQKISDRVKYLRNDLVRVKKIP